MIQINVFFQKSFSLFIFLLLFSCNEAEKHPHYDVIIIGGGASGVAAAVQTSRQGATTLLIEETEWLGGMLTAAGVSAIDGNNNLPSGIWGEFRDSLVTEYGSRRALGSGWVSNTLFEPQVGQRIFTNITGKLPALTVMRKTTVNAVAREGEQWQVKIDSDVVTGKIIIDATELGDIAALVGIPYDIGMQDGDSEPLGPKASNNIIQDLTWVATLRDYGEGEDRTIEKPANYDSTEFDCACNTGTPEIDAVDCKKMLDYGKLPNGDFMINWPNCGNDFYVNVIELSPAERAKKYEKAKEMTLRFVYYIQDHLGFKNIGLAENVYPSDDNLAMIPYHRESRRIHGEVRLLSEHLAHPYGSKLYKTGIAVGDYPIDHHHKKNLAAPKIDFIGIKVPAYSVPMGSLLPKGIDNFIVAEKSISVSNIVNGASRLQPVVLGIGQAAGAIAATAISDQKNVKAVNVRDVQQQLLESGAYLQPFMDINPKDHDFLAIQKAGALGILKGTGIPYKWANQTWVYPDSLMENKDLVAAAKELGLRMAGSKEKYTGPIDIFTFISAFTKELDYKSFMIKIDGSTSSEGFLTRRAVARLVDEFTPLFENPIDYHGNLRSQ